MKTRWTGAGIGPRGGPLLALCVTLASTGCGEAGVAGGRSTREDGGLTRLPAPPFTLPDTSGGADSLDRYRGRWVVLYFYPEDDTPHCTIQATEFTGLLGDFHALNAEVVGISPDPPHRHRYFRDKYGLKITLLSDEDHGVMRAYDAWREARWEGREAGRVVRTTYLIDPEGRIAWRWPQVIAEGHARRVREKLEALQ